MWRFLVRVGKDTVCSLKTVCVAKDPWKLSKPPLIRNLNTDLRTGALCCTPLLWHTLPLKFSGRNLSWSQEGLIMADTTTDIQRTTAEGHCGNYSCFNVLLVSRANIFSIMNSRYDLRHEDYLVCTECQYYDCHTWIRTWAQNIFRNLQWYIHRSYLEFLMTWQKTWGKKSCEGCGLSSKS